MSTKNKLWRKVEDSVAKALGFRRIGFSGGMWPNKEDIEDDFDFICQAKATSGKAVSIRRDDVDALVRRSIIQEKTPLFVFHLDGAKYDCETWVALPIQEFQKIKENYYNERGICDEED